MCRSQNLPKKKHGGVTSTGTSHRAAGSHKSGREGFTERVRKPIVSGKSYFERKGKKENIKPYQIKSRFQPNLHKPV